jgi:phosphoribosyl-AMP cyclohydrolase
MLAYANEKALRLSFSTGLAHYWSRSRAKLWKKGETSGHVQYIRMISLDCDSDALLYLVDQIGVACHKGTWSCFESVIKPWKC